MYSKWIPKLREKSTPFDVRVVVSHKEERKKKRKKAGKKEINRKWAARAKTNYEGALRPMWIRQLTWIQSNPFTTFSIVIANIKLFQFIFHRIFRCVAFFFRHSVQATGHSSVEKELFCVKQMFSLLVCFTCENNDDDVVDDCNVVVTIDQLVSIIASVDVLIAFA